MTGEELLSNVVDLAHQFGWTVAHFRSVRQVRADGTVFYATPVGADGKGFPDLVLVHLRGGVLFREIKGDREQIAPEQQVWARKLMEAGADHAFWRPKGWDEIKSVLSFGRAL
jgi:hypothetical protein